MDRRTAIFLVAIVVLMVGAGAGLLVLMRRIGPAPGEREPPGDLAGSYLAEVEEQCSLKYARPAVGGSERPDGASAGYYLEALDMLPALSDVEWAQILDNTIVDSWNGDSPPDLTAAAQFAPSAARVLEGASRPDGRSPYAFCAVDTDADILGPYRRLARGMEILARARCRSGDEKSAASLLAATLQMELDLGRGGGIVGHAVSISLAVETCTRALVAFAEVARDPAVLRDLGRDLSALDGAWLDLGDNVRLDGLVEETLYASCFMPEGWDAPVGPPVIGPEDRKSICGLGPDLAGGMWKATRERNAEILGALSAPTCTKRHEKLLAIEERTGRSSVLEKILRPQEALAGLAAPAVSPRLLEDVHAHTVLVLARAVVALRLLALETGLLPSVLDEPSWSRLEDDGRPLGDVYTGRRPLYTLEGGVVTLSSPGSTSGMEPASVTASLLSHMSGAPVP